MSTRSHLVPKRGMASGFVGSGALSRPVHWMLCMTSLGLGLGSGLGPANAPDPTPIYSNVGLTTANLKMRNPRKWTIHEI